MSRPEVAKALPLAGLRVLVTRPRHQVEALSSLLREAGAVPVELPVIEIVPIEQGELQDCLGDISSYDWLVFTSVNTVSVVGPLLASVEHMPRVAAIGHATASALRDYGVQVDLVPDSFVGESVVEALVELRVAGSRVLLPRAEVARDALPDGLRAAGAQVDIVPVYQTRRASSVDRDVLAAVRAGDIDIITFTSPSAVMNMLGLTGGALPAGVEIACIGPVTAQAATDAGLRVNVIAETYTVPGLVQALVDKQGSRS